MQLLRHPADARPASQSTAGIDRGGDSFVSRGRREGDQFDQPGHDLLRNGSVDGKGWSATAGRLEARHDAFDVVAPDPGSARRVLGAPALYASGALER